MNQPPTPTPPQRLDPLRVTEAMVFGSPYEIVMVLGRAVFIPGNEGMAQERAASAAVAMPWQVAKQIRDLLSEQISAYEQKHGSIREIEMQEQARPN